MEPVPADAIDEIAALCRRSIWNSPTEEELTRSLYPSDQETVVLGDPLTGVVAAVRDGEEGYIRLVVVAPDLRRVGRGAALLAAAEQWLAGVARITIGGDPHYSLWPGITATDLALVCLAETTGYRRDGVSVTMDVDLKVPLPVDPGGWEVAEEEHAAAVERLLAQAPEHAHEARRAFERGTLVIVPDADGSLAAACAFDVNRAGTLGPLVVPDGGAEPTTVALVGALRSMRQWRHPRAEVHDVGALRPYADLGAKVARLSFVYRKDVR